MITPTSSSGLSDLVAFPSRSSRSRVGFRSLSTSDIWGQISPSCGRLSCALQDV